MEYRGSGRSAGGILHPGQCLACRCAEHVCSAQRVPAPTARRRRPLYWWTDITVDMPEFAAVHLLGINGLASGFEDMSFRPHGLLTAEARQDIEDAVGQPLNWPSNSMTRGQAAQWLIQQLQL